MLRADLGVRYGTFSLYSARSCPISALALIAIVFLSLYFFIVRGWGDVFVRNTQIAMVGFLFPNTSAVVKEF